MEQMDLPYIKRLNLTQHLDIDMKNVEVGPFKLPGIVFEQGELPAELLEDMKHWAEAEGVGMSMTERLWSFKKEAHREWFVLRWSDSIPEIKKDE
ncbi:hypothetical protein UFOVP181_32 [uncultured Caudovirales phage]|uniref:Uncharacterized protein n=1 Tax=uncultured Caudovirales phage TaxID=2100421 RepID=A0A6J5KZB5_9CAUD|nr:hypothetical protein UFOVP57_131 [uncultured Caudovirales phage]CAB5208461.1 hypothetical protein UFOVP181_32 [uncultured Caudovirales phage]